jgi:hypothetical protein
MLAAAPAVGLVAPFWAVAALTRWLARTLPLERPSLRSDQLLELVPHLGQRPRAGLDVRARVDNQLLLSTDLVRVTTDAEGWRDRTLSLDDADIVVFGDGFAFGNGISDDQLFTRLTGNLRTKSVGAPARSMVDSVLWMERLRRRLAGKLVVWLIYLGNDLGDNLHPNLGTRRVPYVRQRTGRWEIHTRHLTGAAWPINGARAGYSSELARFCSEGRESDRALSAARYLIERAAMTCKEAGASLCVMTVPRKSQLEPGGRALLETLSPSPETFDVRRPDRELARWCEELGLSYVALIDHLMAEDYQAGDRLHWRSSGHEKVARLLVERGQPAGASSSARRRVSASSVRVGLAAPPVGKTDEPAT